MTKPTIPVKNQTIHKEVSARGTASFLKLRGSFKVGPGNPVEDVRSAREMMGRLSYSATERA